MTLPMPARNGMMGRRDHITFDGEKVAELVKVLGIFEEIDLEEAANKAVTEAQTFQINWNLAMLSGDARWYDNVDSPEADFARHIEALKASPLTIPPFGPFTDVRSS